MRKVLISMFCFCLIMTIGACVSGQTEQDLKELVNDLSHADGDRTADGMIDNINYWNKKDVYADAKYALEQELQCPSTAVYPAYDASFVTENTDGTWTVVSYVDAQNLMGAMVRIRYQMDIEYSDDGASFSYNLQELQ